MPGCNFCTNMSKYIEANVESRVKHNGNVGVICHDNIRSISMYGIGDRTPTFS